MNIIYKSPFDRQHKVLEANRNGIVPIDELKRLILLKEKIVDNLNLDGIDIFIQLFIPIPGGKGGFGSMLRAIGAQIEKTTNREACRDLSGRRLRDVNEEKRIKEWIKKQADRKKEEEKKKREKLKQIAEGIIAPNCKYDDADFEKFRTEIPDIIDESITQGLQKQQSSSKRKLETENSIDDSSSDNRDQSDKSKDKSPIPIPTKKLAKKHDLWLGVDISDSDDSDQEETLVEKI
nr:replication stress response regulator SDE2-like isoform X2 [Dermatophagoides farinae]